MYKLLITAFALCFLNACSVTNEATEVNEETEVTQKLPAYLQFQKDYLYEQDRSAMKQHGKSIHSEQDLNFYVRGMMQELINNMQYVNAKTAMAVTSFVFLDGSYEYSDIVGKQLAESFVHEVHKYGIPIVDFKATDYIRVTQNGDFILSKDFLDLDAELPIKYVLTGTLVKQPRGYLVNARVVGMKSKAIVATAQGTIPNMIIRSLLPSETNEKGLFVSSSLDN